MSEFTGTYQDRMLPELAYLSMTLDSLNSVHSAMDSALGFTEPALQSAEAEFRRLLQQNILYISREISRQASPRPSLAEGEE